MCACTNILHLYILHKSSYLQYFGYLVTIYSSLHLPLKRMLKPMDRHMGVTHIYTIKIELPMLFYVSCDLSIDSFIYPRIIPSNHWIDISPLLSILYRYKRYSRHPPTIYPSLHLPLDHTHKLLDQHRTHSYKGISSEL